MSDSKDLLEENVFLYREAYALALSLPRIQSARGLLPMTFLHQDNLETLVKEIGEERSTLPNLSLFISITSELYTDIEAGTAVHATNNTLPVLSPEYLSKFRKYGVPPQALLVLVDGVLLATAMHSFPMTITPQVNIREVDGETIVEQIADSISAEVPEDGEGYKTLLNILLFHRVYEHIPKSMKTQIGKKSFADVLNGFNTNL